MPRRKAAPWLTAPGRGDEATDRADLQLAALHRQGDRRGVQQATGIKAEYTEDVNDNNEFFAKIDEPLKRGQSIDRDIVVLTDWMAGRLIKLGYAQAIPDDKFPNKANLVDSLRDVGFDPGRKFSVPWLSGMTGVGYNPKKTGRELTSVNDIFDPKFKGQVTMLTEMRDTLGLVMLGRARTPANCTVDDAKAACAKIKKHRENGHIREVHRQRLRRRPRAGQHRRRHRLVGRHPGSRGGQSRAALDCAQGRCDAVLRQHADPQDLRASRSGRGVDELRL